MQVEFDGLESLWRFRSERPLAGAPATAVLHGIGWTVGTDDPSEPQQVDVEHPTTDFTRAVITILLGAEAGAVLDGPPPATADDEEDDDDDEPTLVGGVATSDDGAARRAAIGVLALALTTPADHPLRAFDTAVLLRRAGLDGSTVTVDGGTAQAALPDADDLADDADEALDLIPASVRAALEAPAPASIATAWAATRAAIDDARRYVATTTGDVLTGISVDEAFDAIALAWGPSGTNDEDGGDGPAARRRSDRSPVFLGTEPGPIPALLADPAIRGIVVAEANVGAGVVEVRVTTRPGAGPVAFRLIAPGDRLLASGPFTPDSADPNRLTAEVTVTETPARVELVRHLGQPVGPLARTAAAHRAAVLGEADRVLAQLSLAGEQTDAARRTQVDALREQVRKSVAALAEAAPPGAPLPSAVTARPSDALQLVLAEVGDQLLADLEQIDDPAIRAIRADEAAILLDGCVLPWAQHLLGRLRLLEAAARIDGGWGSPADVAERAVAAFAAAGAGAADELRAARTFVERHRDGAP